MGALVIEFLDVYGDPLNDNVDVFLKRLDSPFEQAIRAKKASSKLRVSGLDRGIYRLLVYPMRHHAVSQFAQIQGAQTLCSVTFPADAMKVIGCDFPAYKDLGKDLRDVLTASNNVEGFEGGAGVDLFGQLDAPRKAGLLNIYAKMKHTHFPTGTDVFAYVSEFTRLRGDRVFARVAKELRDETKNSQVTHLFHEAPEGMHTPPPDYFAADSYKTFDHYGNLQLSFFSKATSLDFIVDADIDDAQGIEHAFQVISHIATGGDTNPYDIHEILIGFQKCDPGYSLDV
jgi:hypothetical protein